MGHSKANSGILRAQQRSISLTATWVSPTSRARGFRYVATGRILLWRAAELVRNQCTMTPSLPGKIFMTGLGAANEAVLVWGVKALVVRQSGTCP